jgi:hypothetical protein
MTMPRFTVLLLLFALTACETTDPYLRAGAWRPNGANEANLRAMVVVPADLVAAVPPGRADGDLAAAAVDRLHHDHVRSLPDSGVAQIEVVGNGAAAGLAAALPSGTAN